MARPQRTAPPAASGHEETSGPWDWPGPGLAALIYFGLAALYFLPAFMPGNHLYGSDYLAAGYFSHEFVSERIAAGALPRWAPYLYGGVPWFANPGSTYYPFRFLVDLLFAPHRIFAGMFVIQFALAGFGTYLLSRELGARRWVSLIGGLAFMFTGLVMSYVLAGHDGRIIVATFTPLFLFFLHRGVRTGALGWFAGAALTLGSSLLSFQIQSNYYLLLLGAAWGVFALVRVGPRGARAIAGRTGLGLGAVAAGFLLAAINFLPFMSYVDASPRSGGGRGYEYATSWAMPPAEITGVVLPEQAGLLDLYEGDNPFKLHTEYAGAVVALLLVLGAFYARRDRYWWFFLGAAVVGLTFAFGGHTPIYRLYYALLPGTTMFRAPSISFFVVSFSLVMMATVALDRVADRRDPGSRGTDSASRDAGSDAGSDASRGDGARPGLGVATWVIGGVVGLALLVVLVASSASDPHGQALAKGAFRLFAFSALAGGALWAWLHGKLPTGALAILLALVTVADLWLVDRMFFRTVDEPAVMMARDDVVDFLEARESEARARVWVLPAAVQRQQEYGGGLRNYLMRFHIDMAGGEHGNQLQPYNEFVGAGETTYVDWHNFLADLQGLIDPSVPGASPAPNFLAAANVRYVVATVLLPGLQEAYRGRTGVVYEVPQALPRAYLVDDVVLADAPAGALDRLREPGFDPARSVVLYEPLPGAPMSVAAASSATPASPATPGRVAIQRYEPERVVVRADADRPAVLVLADNYYPGWEATVDGEPAEIGRANHTFRAVAVPAGSHEVVFEFRPPSFYTGAWITLLTLVGLLAVAAVSVWRARVAAGGREAPTPG